MIVRPMEIAFESMAANVRSDSPEKVHTEPSAKAMVGSQLLTILFAALNTLEYTSALLCIENL